MKVWRIRLKDTDLYYQPVKGRWDGEKSNLGPRGKVYLTKPSLKHCGTSLYFSDANHKKYPAIPFYINAPPRKQKNIRVDGFLEIIEYDCVEKGAVN